CIVLDLDLGNGPQDGITFLEKIKSQKGISKVPVIIFTGLELSKEEERRISSLSTKIISKNAQSLDQLIVETEKFLHNISDSPELTVKMPDYMIEALENKTALLV